MTAPSTRVWEHVAEWGLLAGAAALSAVATLPAWGVPGWSLAAIEAAAAVIGMLIAGAHTSSKLFSAWCLAYGLWLSGWSAWAWGRGLWHPVVVTWWVIGALVLIPLGALALGHRRAPERAAIEAGPDDEELARREELARWNHMFITLGLTGVETQEVKTEAGGRVARLVLPRSGDVTITSLEAVAGRIEVILKTRPGAVEFTHGENSSDIYLRVRERDALAKSIPLSPLHYATTIKNPFAIGMLETGPLANISMREVHAYIIGMTGAGKSNLLNVLIAQLGHCVDTVIWMIDMKGGRAARPWVQPWADNKTERPTIDWVATTREEAALMMNCFVAAINTRMNSGVGGSKITPSPEMPQLILLCDEAAELLGTERGNRSDLPDGATINRQFLRMGERMIQMGRSEAASTVWATQRATHSMAGNNDMKSQCKLRILLGVSDENEARYFLPDDRAAQKRAVAAKGIKGAGVIQTGKDSSPMVKFFLHDHPEDPSRPGGEDSLCDNGCVPSCPVQKTAIETGQMRPALDSITVSGLSDTPGMAEAYAGRWTKERTGNLLTRQPARAAAKAAPVAAAGGPSFEEVLAGGGMQDPDIKVDPRRVRMRELLAQRGTQGATPKFLVSRLETEGAGATREAVQRWLAADQELGLLHNHGYGLWMFGSRDESAA